MVEWSCTKERIIVNKEDHINWSNGCVQIKEIISEDPNFWHNGCPQKKQQMKEDHIFWSNSRVHIKEINQWGP